MPDRVRYGWGDGSIYRLEYDPSGIILQNKTKIEWYDYEEIITGVNYIVESGSRHMADEDFAESKFNVNDEDLIRYVIQPLLDHFKSGELPDEIEATNLHRALGDNNNTIKLTKQAGGIQVAIAIWGEKKVLEVLNAAGDQDVVASGEGGGVGSTIVNSQSQGTPPPDSSTDEGKQNSKGKGKGSVSSSSTTGDNKGGPKPGNNDGNDDTNGSGNSAEGRPNGGGKGNKGGTSGSNNTGDTNGNGTSSGTGDGKTGGDPLVLFSGQFYYQMKDLEVKGRGLYFSFVRTYFHQTLYNGPLGHHWDHCYNLWLREEQHMLSNGELQNVVYRSTGRVREDKYVQKLEVNNNDLPPLSEFADAEFIGPTGFLDRLVKIGGKYVLETITGVLFEYNADLYIDRIVDPNGNVMSFTYESDTNMLKTIRDPVGKLFVFEYDEVNRIKMIYDLKEDGSPYRRISYTYGINNDLEEVDFFLEPDMVFGIDYHYLGPDYPFELQHNISEIINPLGESILENEYGLSPGLWDYNRVIRQRSEDGEYRYEYGPIFETEVDQGLDEANVPRSWTRVYYPNDHIIEHWFNKQGNVVQRLEQIINMASVIQEIVSKYRYNEDGMIIEEILADGSGAEYQYERDIYAEIHGGDMSGASAAERLIFGNLKRKVLRPRDGLGETRRIVTEYTYQLNPNRLSSQRGPYYADILLNPLSTENISEFHYDYDVKGNLIRIRYPDVQLPDGSINSVTPQEYIYNDHGLVTDFLIGTLHIKFSYFGDTLRSGFVSQKMINVGDILQITNYETDYIGRVTQTVDHFGATTNIEWTTFDAPKVIHLPEIVPGMPRPTLIYKYNKNRLLTHVIEDIKLHDGSPHPNGGQICRTYQYDTYGRLLKYESGPTEKTMERFMRRVLTPFGLIEKDIDTSGNITFTRYDERMYIRSLTRGYGTTENATRYWHYDILGRLIESVDGRGFKTELKYDSFGRLHFIRDADGNEIEMEYDASDTIIRIQLFQTSPISGQRSRWGETNFSYDSIGRLTTRTDFLFTPSVQNLPNNDRTYQTKYYYDILNRIVRIIGSEGNTYEFTYDNLDRITYSRDPDGNEIKWTYDDFNRTITTISKYIGQDDTGTSVIQVFREITQLDTRGLPIKHIDSLGNLTRWGFDSREFQTYFSDAQGNETFTDYNIYGEPTHLRTEIDNQEVITEIKHNTHTRTTTIVTPVGGTISVMNDKLDRPIRLDSGNNSITYEYDQEDNIVLQRDENGILTRRFYSPTGLLVKQETDTGNFTPPADDLSYLPSDTSPIEFKYTPFGTVSEAYNDVASVTMDYDSFGRMIRESYNGKSIQYEYDGENNLTKLIYPDGRRLRYEYSPGGFHIGIMQESIGANYPGDLSLSSNRRLLSIWNAGENQLIKNFTGIQKTRFHYDPGSRIIGLESEHDPSGALLRQEVNMYGSRGEWILHMDLDKLRLEDYDKANRLIKALDYEGTASINLSELKPPNSDSDSDLNAASSQTDIDEIIENIRSNAEASMTLNRSISYVLDLNSNRLRSDESTFNPNSTASTFYVPDSQDRYNFINSNKIVYDKAGNMLNDGTNKYRYNAYNLLTEIQTPTGKIEISRDPLTRPIRIRDTFQATTTDYLFSGQKIIQWDINNSVTAQLVPMLKLNQYAHLATNGMDYAPLVNVMDSLLGWVKSNGSIEGRTRYDPFGRILEQDTLSPAPFGFAGYFLFPNQTIYNLAARSYHPTYGIFLQRDPAGLIDGTNLYAYCKHSPGTFIDYLGFDSSIGLNWGNTGRALSLFGSSLLLGAFGLLLALTAPFSAIFTILAGTLMLATGIAGTVMGIVTLATAHTRTSEQDIELHRGISTVKNITSGPGSLIGATVAAASGGDLERGATYGSFAELGTLVTGGFLNKMGLLGKPFGSWRIFGNNAGLVGKYIRQERSVPRGVIKGIRGLFRWELRTAKDQAAAARKAYWDAGSRGAQRAGVAQHHWFFPNRSLVADEIKQARWNFIEIDAGVNSAMGRSRHMDMLEGLWRYTFIAGMIQHGEKYYDMTRKLNSDSQ